MLPRLNRNTLAAKTGGNDSFLHSKRLENLQARPSANQERCDSQRRAGKIGANIRHPASHRHARQLRQSLYLWWRISAHNLPGRIGNLATNQRPAALGKKDGSLSIRVRWEEHTSE